MQLNESIIVPIIMAIVELAKSVGIPKKFSALLSVVVGIVIGIFYLHPLEIKLGIFEGIVYGLTASGLYSGAKNTFQQFRDHKNNMH
jgi:L-cystine uptake protein TcyP (sodium:dicarboxylate symporter family)